MLLKWKFLDKEGGEMLFHIKMFDLLVTLPLSEPLEYLKAPILYDFVFLFFALLVTSYELSFKKYAL